MNGLISVGWFIIGIFWVVAGKPFLEVAACFLVCGIFSGAAELSELRRELEDWEESDDLSELRRKLEDWEEDE